MGVGFVGVCLEWGVSKTLCFVVNIYAKCNLADKRKLWYDLIMSKRGFGGGKWCVAGDFNSINRREDMRGVNEASSSLISMEMREFGEFMETMDLVDLPLLGRRFTWFHPNGRSMSRIDKFLVSEEWSDVWGVCSLWVLPRDISDHCPLILKKDNFDWGPRPFRFNNYWLEHKNFKKIVEETWRNHNVSGWMGHILKEKLKNLK
jgi:hypothetical protein